MHWATDAPEDWSLERPPEMRDFNGDRGQWDKARNTWYARTTKKDLPAIKDSVARERDWVRALNARLKRPSVCRCVPRRSCLNTTSPFALVHVTAAEPVCVGPFDT